MDSVIKWPGGKHFLAAKIVALMPPRFSPETPQGYLHYVEPFFGSGAVLFANDPEGISEVANDASELLMNFWGVLRCEWAFLNFSQLMCNVPFSEQVWQMAYDHINPRRCTMRYPTVCTGCASAFFICVRQSLAARMEGFAPLSKTRVRRGMSEQASAWLSAIDHLPAVHERLSRVVLLNRPAGECIASQDGEQTLFYCDPPYVHETRNSTTEYRLHEMSDSQHFDLVEQLRSCRGKVMLSGYRCKLYDERLNGWNRHDFQIANSAAGGGSKRVMTESVWCNF